MELLNLRDLLSHEIDDLYSAEEQIIEALPKMVENAKDSQLKKALNDHLKVTREQKTRLDKIRKLLKKGEETEKKGLFERIFGSSSKCKGTEGLITEGEKMMGEDMEQNVKDAAIIAAAQKIEHYEISGYGTARAYARELGLSEVVKLLEATLNEEYKADDDLTKLALRKVNIKAEAGSLRISQRNNGTKKTVQKPPLKKGTNKKAGASKKTANKKSVSKA